VVSIRIAVTAPPRAGKTGVLRYLRDRLREEGVTVGGILQPAVGCGPGPRAYLLEDAATGEQRDFVSRDTRTRRPVFDPAGWRWAARRIRHARAAAVVLLVDELGLREARGGGHLRALLEPAPREAARIWLLAVRDSAADAVARQIGPFHRVLDPRAGNAAIWAAVEPLFTGAGVRPAAPRARS
jgi:nucleoside-triphosphatase THEP1